jgi:hypothetical protein
VGKGYFGCREAPYSDFCKISPNAHGGMVGWEKSLKLPKWQLLKIARLNVAVEADLCEAICIMMVIMSGGAETMKIAI